MTLQAKPGLATKALRLLRDALAGYDAKPTASQERAIKELLGHLAAAADGNLRAKFYVNTMPCGCAKTQSVIAFAKALASDRTRDDVGMLMLVNRLEDIRSVADHLSAFKPKLCILSSDPKTNIMGGCKNADDAQLCIATQEALRRGIKLAPGGHFVLAGRFYYRSKPRAVRCWDESLSWRRPVVIDGDGILALTKAFKRNGWGHAAIHLKGWSVQLDEMEDGSITNAPDFEMLDVNFEVLEETVTEDDLKAQVRALAEISGDRGLVKKIGVQSAVVTHIQELPHSMMPFVATDASARINPTYEQFDKRYPGLTHWMTEKVEKSYAKLSIKTVPVAASRTSFRDANGATAVKLLDIVAKHIATLPASEEVLCIGYKGVFRISGFKRPVPLPEALQARLTSAGLPHKVNTNPDLKVRAQLHHKVAWLDYGSHTSTNAYSAVRHVILLGLFFVPPVVNYAAAAAAQNLDLTCQAPTAVDVRQMRNGTLMDATMQAILRGHARTNHVGICGECDALVLQSTQAGLSAADYRTMFPDVQLTRDDSLVDKKPLTGNAAKAAQVLRKVKADRCREVSNEVLYTEAGMTKQAFQRVSQTEGWRDLLEELGAIPQPLKGNRPGLRFV